MITNIVVRTPLLSMETVCETSFVAAQNNRLFLKPENLQPFGSYKIRGVLEAIRRAPREVVQRGLATASAGNMAQAVAFAARELNVPCTVYIPETAPDIKKVAIRKLGASVVELPFAAVWKMVREYPESFAGLFIHPVLTPGLQEGYSTIASEILADRPSLDAVIIPFGVGGLTLGVGRALKRINPQLAIYACEPETAAPLFASFREGRAVAIERRPSFVDAIGTSEVLPYVFSEAQKIVTESLVVTLAQVEKAIAQILVSSKLVCEGAAAASVAAAQQLLRRHPKMEIACLLTGGNLPPETLSKCLSNLDGSLGDVVRSTPDVRTSLNASAKI